MPLENKINQCNERERGSGSHEQRMKWEGHHRIPGYALRKRPRQRSISRNRKAHFFNRMTGTLSFLDVTGQITWDISSRCIVKCPKIVNNIIKAKGSVGRLLGRK